MLGLVGIDRQRCIGLAAKRDCVSAWHGRCCEQFGVTIDGFNVIGPRDNPVPAVAWRPEDLRPAFIMQSSPFRERLFGGTLEEDVEILHEMRRNMSRDTRLNLGKLCAHLSEPFTAFCKNNA